MLLRRWSRLRLGNSLVHHDDPVGQVGQVLLPCGPTQRGLVRLRVRGSLLDLCAYASDQRLLLRGERVLVVQQHDQLLWVTALDAPEEDLSTPPIR